MFIGNQKNGEVEPHHFFDLLAIFLASGSACARLEKHLLKEQEHQPKSIRQIEKYALLTC
jgi:hypothetical protein